MPAPARPTRSGRTAVIARTDEKGRKALERRVPKRLRGAVDDSKRLVSHTDVRLGEAWARELAPSDAASPEALFEALSLEGSKKLREPCPREAEAQCWHGLDGAFEATDKDRRRVARHRELLAKRGIELVGVKTSVVCTDRLNAARREKRFEMISPIVGLAERFVSGPAFSSRTLVGKGFEA